MSASTSTSFKIVAFGDSGVGKTTFFKRHRTGEFEKHYVATMGVEVNPLSLHTSRGPYVLNIWDTAGQEKFNGLGAGYAIGAQAAIIMCDVTSFITFRSFTSYLQLIQKECGDVPIVFCGNKMDCKERKVTPKQITAFIQSVKLKQPGLRFEYYDVSAKSNYNLEKPFLYLLRQLIRDETLTLVYGPAMRYPPKVVINPAPTPDSNISPLELSRRPRSRPERMIPSFQSPFYLPGVHWEPHPKRFPVQGRRLLGQYFYYWGIYEDCVKLSIVEQALDEPIVCGIEWLFSEYSPQEAATINLKGEFSHPCDVGALQAALRSVQ